MDPASINDDTVYKLLSTATANVQVSDFINTATKVDQKFSDLYADIHDGKNPQPKVRLCPQVLGMIPVVAGASALQFAQEVETALCPTEAQGRRASGVFLYSFGDKEESLTSDVGPFADIDVDHIKLTYARRHYYTLKSPSDLHAEYYATGDKDSFGSGSLLAALLSISGSNNTISNTGFEYGYAACLGAMPVIGDTRTTTQTLPQMQGLASLYVRFNAAMSQIDGWAAVPDTSAAACDGSKLPVVTSETKSPQSLARGADSR
ncbi:hypothetical protein [Chromobacterium subtsugae]|uniref:hypothetical protein n=1 Tax=Chromobacterium subtsugae TaxID=251747 RepID=UPI00128BEFFA|nr:hypothetical protein [Chromobacterium subtsugae]